jgi:hypothetical protein
MFQKTYVFANSIFFHRKKETNQRFRCLECTTLYLCSNWDSAVQIICQEKKVSYHLREKIAFRKNIYFNPIAEMLKHKYWNCNPIPPISQNIDTS